MCKETFKVKEPTRKEKALIRVFARGAAEKFSNFAKENVTTDELWCALSAFVFALVEAEIITINSDTVLKEVAKDAGN